MTTASFVFATILNAGLAVMAIVGWVLNLIALAGLIIHSEPVTALLIGRMAGVFFATIGVVLVCQTRAPKRRP